MDRQYISLVIISCFFLLVINVSQAKDSLEAGEVLNAGEFLESNNEHFKFSFNNTVFPSYTRLYIRYVYNNSSRILWYLDKLDQESDTDAASSICIDEDGDIALSRSRCDSGNIRNVTATLLDNGNLILVDQELVLWQSFDHPSYTWLQGMKLGTSGLISSIDLTTPVLYNYYTFGVDPSNPNQLIAKQSDFGNVYWNSGRWDQQNSFLKFLAESGFNITFTIAFDTQGRNFFTFSSDNDPFAFFLLDNEGIIHLSSGNLSAKHEAIIDCGTNHVKFKNYTTKGCVFCEDGDDFVQMNGTLDVWDDYRFYNNSNSELDCNGLCINNCSCTAYAFIFVGYSDGHIPRFICKTSGSRRYDGRRQEDKFFLRNKVNLDKVSHGLSLVKKVGLSIVVVAAVLVALALLGTFCYVQRRNHHFKDLRRFIGFQKSKQYGKLDDESLSFTFGSIEVATDQFSNENKLGQGGYGPVYKGELYNGQEIAVKRLLRKTKHGEEQFKNEVAVISKLQHRNLVRLLGYCIHNEERILVYEYLPNNSLESILFGLHKQTIIDWKTRLHIIEGIAQGLLYLHRYSRFTIIHRDLKTGNILLDTNLNPKISDFGTARISGDDLFSGGTNRISGTLGYMSPEYATNGVFSTKSDVYSFGVIMLEIISGRKNSDFYDSDNYMSLLAYVWDFWINGRVVEITDPNLVEKVPKQEVSRFVQIGLLCVQENAPDRPTMSAVLSMITNISLVLPTPKQPGFSAIIGLKNENASGMPEILSINKVTITEVEGR